MLSVRPWRTEALVRLALGVAVCVFMGVLSMNFLRLAEPGVHVNLLLFYGIVVAGYVAFGVALVLTRRPFNLEESLRRLMVFLASLYLGLALAAVAQMLTSPSSKFSVSDVVDLPSLAGKLKQPTDPVSACLKTQLSSATLTALASHQDSNSNPEPLQTVLVADLNRIIDGKTMYDREQFTGVALRPETRQLLDEKPRGAARPRLNRLLLEDAYPLELWKSVREASAQPSLWQMVVAGISFQGSALVLIGLFLREQRRTWAEGFGFWNGQGRAVCLGLLAAMIVLPVAWLLQMGVATVLMRLHFEADPQTAVQLLHDAPTWLDRLPLAFIAIVLAPPAEEMLFRGLLYPAVKDAGLPRLALWGTALLFAGIHWNALSFLSLVLLALVLTWLYEKTSNLLAPIAAHSLFNALNFAALLFYERIPENLR